MAVQLDDNDFPQLINILAKLPDLANVWDRRRLLESTLEGTPRSEDLLRGIALEGTPLGASTGIVRFLQTFGQVASGKEALGVFLNRLQSYVGEEDASFIRRFPSATGVATRLQPPFKRRSSARTPSSIFAFCNWRSMPPQPWFI
jgi:hypothetical protein